MKFLEMARKVLEETKKPMTCGEIWNYIKNTGLISELDTKGRTPYRTLNARLSGIVLSHPEGPFFRTEDSPHRYYLADSNVNSEKSGTEIPPTTKNFNERKLHPLLSYFVNHDPRFHCVTKTILQEKSAKGVKGENEWLHPDLVGFYFPYEYYRKETLDLSNYFNANQFRLYSFEMKKDVSFWNLREYYFQAVSNSSWANEGYLVALNFSDNPEFQDELSRLNRAFGIGVIQLDPEEISSSQILFPARENKIDWDTVNRLADRNSDFRKFIDEVIGAIKAEKIHKEGYDKIYSSDELIRYMKDASILEE